MKAITRDQHSLHTTNLFLFESSSTVETERVLLRREEELDIVLVRVLRVRVPMQMSAEFFKFRRRSLFRFGEVFFASEKRLLGETGTYELCQKGSYVDWLKSLKRQWFSKSTRTKVECMLCDVCPEQNEHSIALLLCQDCCCVALPPTSAGVVIPLTCDHCFEPVTQRAVCLLLCESCGQKTHAHADPLLFLKSAIEQCCQADDLTRIKQTRNLLFWQLQRSLSSASYRFCRFLLFECRKSGSGVRRVAFGALPRR